MLARLRKSAEENERGFTLIELLVVMIIIGILAAIAVPVFLSQRQKARDTATKADISSIGKEVAAYYVDGTDTLAVAVASKTATISTTNPVATVATVKLSDGTGYVATGETTAIKYSTGTGCNTANNAGRWFVGLKNADGSGSGTFFYTAWGGLTSTTVTTTTPCT